MKLRVFVSISFLKGLNIWLNRVVKVIKKVSKQRQQQQLPVGPCLRGVWGDPEKHFEKHVGVENF